MIVMSTTYGPRHIKNDPTSDRDVTLRAQAYGADVSFTYPESLIEDSGLRPNVVVGRMLEQMGKALQRLEGPSVG